MCPLHSGGEAKTKFRIVCKSSLCSLVLSKKKSVLTAITFLSTGQGHDGDYCKYELHRARKSEKRQYRPPDVVKRPSDTNYIIRQSRECLAPTPPLAPPTTRDLRPELNSSFTRAFYFFGTSDVLFRLYSSFMQKKKARNIQVEGDQSVDLHFFFHIEGKNILIWDRTHGLPFQAHTL